MSNLGKIVDVSLGGFCARSREKYEVASMHRLDHDGVKVDCEVRFCAPIEDSDLYAVGFKVKPASNEERINWIDYVHRVFQHQDEEGR